MSWHIPDGNGANNWGGSNGGLQGRSSRRKKESSGCCFAGQAVKAVWAGKFKLARRFARLDFKTRLGVI